MNSNDFRLAESYRHQAGRLLGCPIGAFGGDRDPTVEPAEPDRWAECITGAFTSRVLPSGHFYLASETAGVLTDVQRPRAHHPAAVTKGIGSTRRDRTRSP